MKAQTHFYYCYMKQGNMVIQDKEPDNFSILPFNYVAQSPNSEIAERVYRTNLKIMGWRAVA